MHVFYTPDIQSQAELPEEEAAHAVRVLRLQTGDEVTLTDGKGNFYRAEISTATTKRCLVNILETIPQAPLWSGHLHIAMSWKVALVSACHRGDDQCIGKEVPGIVLKDNYRPFPALFRTNERAKIREIHITALIDPVFLHFFCFSFHFSFIHRLVSRAGISTSGCCCLLCQAGQ